MVTKETLKEEAYNCNIRRYVDNSEAPTPQDVKAHLNGGIPQNEIDSLKKMFDCYGELQKHIFKDSEDNYADFVDEVKDKNDIKNIIFSSEGKNMVMSNYSDAVDAFWKNSSDDLENLHGGSIFDYNNNLTERFVSELTKQNVLDKYQVRGSFAHFSDTLSSDFRSVQSSGWTAELIPDDELIANEFPEVLADQKRLENRRDELDAKFAEIAEIEPEEWDAEQYELMPKAVISEVKAEIKELKSQRTKLNKEKKALEKRLKSGADVKPALVRCEQELAETEKQIEEKEAGIAHHVNLENELKDCRKKLREIEVNKESLADKAREQISNDDARRLICERWLKTLHDTVNVYLEAHTRRLQQAVELLYDKYSVTLTSLIEERKAATEEFENYLIELGYIEKMNN